MEFNYSLICKDNILILSVEKLWKDSEMAVYVYCNDERLEVSWYKECFEYQFKIPEKLVSENFYLSIFIKNGSKIYSKKTIVVNPETCQKKISLDLFEINNLSNIFDIEKYVNTLAIKSHCSLCDLIHNLVENNYSFNNLLFTDYIFIRYSLFKLGLPGNWSNDEFSLGLLNEASINEILELSQVWYSGLKITDFTKSLIKSFYYMNKGDYDMTYDVLNLFEIPKNYYFSVYFQGLITYQSTVLDKLNFPYTVKETSIVASPNQLTIVFSCNKIYFDKFFHNTLESLVSVYNSFNIAISLVNFTESDMEEFIFIKLDIEKKYNIIISYMKIETNYHEKTLSACSRFIIAYEIMSRELNDLLVVDLDVYFTEESIRQLKLIIDENKISLSLKTNLQRLIPWTAVAAGASYFPNRNSSLNFLKNIVNYINYSYNPEYNWYLDQNALFYAYRVCKNLYPMEKINNIHRFTSSLLTKNDSIDLIRWKRSLVGEYGLTN